MPAHRSKYSRSVAVILGIIILFLPDWGRGSIPLALIYLAAGCLLGHIWYAESWRWGLWVAGPMYTMIGLSVALSGYLEVFLEKDLPVMVLALMSACAGSFLGAWYKHKRLMI